MVRNDPPRLPLRLDGRGADGADPLADPALYEGVLWRRVLAHLFDWLLISAVIGVAVVALWVANIMTLGLLSLPAALAGAVLPAVYFIAFGGGPWAATPGMRLLKIALRDLEGEPPDYLQATLRTAMYYASVTLLTPLVLVVALLNARRRTVHDYLSATVVITPPSSSPR